MGQKTSVLSIDILHFLFLYVYRTPHYNQEPLQHSLHTFHTQEHVLRKRLVYDVNYSTSHIYFDNMVTILTYQYRFHFNLTSINVAKAIFTQIAISSTNSTFIYPFIVLAVENGVPMTIWFQCIKPNKVWRKTLFTSTYLVQICAKRIVV